MNQGWVKLYRELKSKAIWQLSSPQHKVVLITILLLANHEENKWVWKGEEFYCKPGQLITSLSSLVKECGEGVTSRNVRTALDNFEKLGFLTNTSTKTGRLITIVNWDKYQSINYVNDKVTDKEPTKSRQRGDKEPTTNKNIRIKENKNILPLTPSRGEGEGNKNLIDTFWESYPKKVGRGNVEEWFNKNKPNEEQFQVMLNKLEEFKKTNQWEKSDGRFIPHPINWLNAKSWEDESSIDGMVETREEEIARLEKKVQQMKKSGEWK